MICPFCEDPFDAVGSFGVQLALAAAAVSLVRAFRPLAAGGGPAERQLLAARSSVVAVLAVAVTLGADGIAMVRYHSSWAGRHAGGELAALVNGIALLTASAAWGTSRAMKGVEAPAPPPGRGRLFLIPLLAIPALALYPAQSRQGVSGTILTALAGTALLFLSVWVIATALLPPPDPRTPDLLDDLSVIWRRWIGRAGTAIPVSPAGDDIPPPHPSGRWPAQLDPRRHPWRLVALAGGAVGLALALAEAFDEGRPGALGRLALVAAVFVGIEGAGVALGYALLGRYLGLFRSDPSGWAASPSISADPTVGGRGRA